MKTTRGERCWWPEIEGAPIFLYGPTEWRPKKKWKDEEKNQQINIHLGKILKDFKIFFPSEKLRWGQFSWMPRDIKMSKWYEGDLYWICLQKWHISREMPQKVSCCARIQWSWVFLRNKSFHRSWNLNLPVQLWECSLVIPESKTHTSGMGLAFFSLKSISYSIPI